MRVLITKRSLFFALLFTIIYAMAAGLVKSTWTYAAPEISKDEVKNEVERIYKIRSRALASGDISTLKENYDISQKLGRYALEHEIKRVKYLNNWSAQRNIDIENIESTVRVKKVTPAGNIIKAYLEETYRFDYVYEKDESETINSFGVGIRHSISLTKKNDKWLVYSDWYTDCFEDALQAYTADIPIAAGNSISYIKLPSAAEREAANFANSRKRYNRQKAVFYADKYCGAAWGSGFDFKYNPKYMNFNGAGGDCTNFASQVLGDKEGGGLPQDGAWHCDLPKYGRGQGTAAWVNADGLKNYVLYSGKASIIKVGTFKELTAATPELPGGAVSKLCLGDLICYEKGRGNIDHFAVVTGFDSKGYPLVNSHTTDRYHVPWDLGWGDKKIRFFLLHVRD